ncbi:MAG: LLM class flavin-dependent oxidoreductase [Alphaproteobacteria bacterium]|nr:LLM class flavin-dependent oxidoreductase [Alphaproteobacteria bacterium]
MDFLLMTEGGIDAEGPGGPPSVPQRFREVIAEAKLADEVGFDVFGCGEQHFDPPYWTISNPETMLAAIARETKRIRLRSTIVLLPLIHPLRLAEIIGTIDILSDGRFEIGTGKGNNSIAIKAFEVPFSELDERYEEALTVIKGALSNDRFSHRGKYFSFDEIEVLPKSIQKPHPPIYFAAISPQSHVVAGRNGLGLLTLSTAMSRPQIEKRFRIYHESFREQPGALKKISLGLQTYCCADGAAARTHARDSILRYLKRTIFLYEKTLQEKGLNLDFSNTKKITSDFEFLARERLLAIGDPKEVIDTFRYYEQLGVQEIRIRCDGLPHEMLMANIRMLADKVIPHFK